MVVPLLLYAAWYAGWGHTGPSYLSFSNVANSLGRTCSTGSPSGVASLLGLTPSGFVTGSGPWGRPLLLGLIAVTVLRVRSGPPVSRWFWVSVVVLLSFWFLTAFNATPRSARRIASRYQYIAAVLLLLVAADLAAGVVRTRQDRGRDRARRSPAASVREPFGAAPRYLAFRDVTPAIRGGLAGLEIDRRHGRSGSRRSNEQNSGFNYIGSIRAGPYLSAVREFGSPAYSQSELPSAPERARESADLVTATALRLARCKAHRAGGPPGAAARRVGCSSVGRPRVLSRPLPEPPSTSARGSGRHRAARPPALRDPVLPGDAGHADAARRS